MFQHHDGKPESLKFSFLQCSLLLLSLSSLASVLSTLQILLVIPAPCVTLRHYHILLHKLSGMWLSNHSRIRRLHCRGFLYSLRKLLEMCQSDLEDKQSGAFISVLGMWQTTHNHTDRWSVWGSLRLTPTATVHKYIGIHITCILYVPLHQMYHSQHKYWLDYVIPVHWHYQRHQKVGRR